MDIIVTTPLTRRRHAAAEARECIEAGGGSYFRRLKGRPRRLKEGDRVYYVEAAQVRGFALVDSIVYQPGCVTCQTTGRVFSPGWYVWVDATSWKWITPIPMQGFQGFRYADLPNVEVIGGWLDPKPTA